MDGFPVHAVIVDGSVIVREIGAVTYHRVDGRAVHPTKSTVVLPAHGRVDGSVWHRDMGDTCLET